MYVLQNGQSSQDVALHGSTPEFDYLVVSDGHGGGPRKHVLREFIKTLDWDNIFQYSDWYKNDIDSGGTYASPLFRSLHSGLDAFSDQYNTKQGCTLSVVLIYKDRFECFTIGDSTIKIWEEDSHRLVWKRTARNSRSRYSLSRRCGRNWSSDAVRMLCLQESVGKRIVV